jgi:hypothetical protein
MGQGLYALALFLGPQVSEDNPSAEAPLLTSPRCIFFALTRSGQP